MALGERKVWVSPADPAFVYEGRIDLEDPKAPIFVYACSYVKFRISGTWCALAIENHHSYFENSLGVLVDGEYRGKIVLKDDSRPVGETLEEYLLRLDAENAALDDFKGLREGGLCPEARFYDLSAFLDGGEHEITVFKRMDACHYFTFYGLAALEGACKAPLSKLPERRIEVFGDSVSCGEVSEAVGRCGMSDPEGHDGIYSNSFYSYSWILARKLGARLHDTSQGGIALQDGEGYFNEPDRRGMLSTYDKIQYNPSLGPLKQWDLKAYVPQLVIVAIGQNDAHPVNYMKEDYKGELAVKWRKRYGEFLKLLRGHYPNAEIILSTTILGHDREWDQAIDQVCRECGDPKVHHFLYSLNGCGTSGHIRRPEAEKMAEEMEAFIHSLGNIWGE